MPVGRRFGFFVAKVCDSRSWEVLELYTMTRSCQDRVGGLHSG